MRILGGQACGEVWERLGEQKVSESAAPLGGRGGETSGWEAELPGEQFTISRFISRGAAYEAQPC